MDDQRSTPPEGDYGYDEAHDVPSADAHRSPEHPPAPARVPTQTRDDAGDYSYDLAHEIPPA